MIFSALLSLAVHSILPPRWLDAHQPIQTRVADLLSRMTLDEKVGQMVNSAPALPRLGIPRYQWWSEALHGVTKPAPCTSFPQCIGLGATFDTELERRIATAISDEARARFHDERRRGVERDDLGLDFWAPNINIFRDPRWGRGQETYGEDPYLTGQMAIQFVRGMQGDNPKYLKTIATPKHFAVHSGPDEIRYSFNAVASPRDMWLTYLPAFQNAIVDGGAWSIMGAYSSLNGEPACASKFLLEDVLRKRWGFKGYVVSDCGAIGNIWRDHHFVSSEEKAAAIAVQRGCDLDCGGEYGALKRAVDQHLISEAEIDRAVARLFEARFKLGLFDPAGSVPYANIPMSVVASPKHVALAREAAQKSMVLLKNDGALPLKRTGSIAIIGPNGDAKDTLLGNYQGQPKEIVSIVEGFRKALPQAQVRFVKGCDLTSASSLVTIPAEAFSSVDSKLGLMQEVFGNKELKGAPLFRRRVATVDQDWDKGAPALDMSPDDFSVRWTGTLQPPRSGNYRIGMTNDDGMRVWLDGKLILDDWRDDAERTSSVEVRLQKGQSYNLKVEYYESKVYAVAKLVWSPPETNPFAPAIAAAKAADRIIVVLGLSSAIEGESVDRKSLGLPKVQVELLRAIQRSTKKPITLVLVNGSPLILGPDELKCSAILEAWYPGMQGGNAVADLVLGKVSPSGRLPVTVVRSMADLPPFASYEMKARTYRYPGAKPQFPFGFGLSYSSFAYSSLSMPRSVKRGSGVELGVIVANTGRRDADEIVQVYRHFVKPSRAMPEQQLITFTRVHLRAGEKRRVRLKVPAGQLAVLGDDTYLHGETGPIDLSIGGGQPDFAKTLTRRIQIR